MLIRQNLNKINILILLVLIQSFLYSSQDKKDNVLDNFIPNANLAKLISDYTVDWQLYKTIDAKETSDITSFAISPNGEYLASGYQDGKVKIWSSENGTLLTNFYALKSFKVGFGLGRKGGQIVNMAFSQPNGKYLAVADPSWTANLIQIFDSETGKEVHEIAYYAQPTYSKNGKYLAAMDNYRHIRIFNANDYSIIKNFSEDNSTIGSLIFAPNNKYLAYSLSNRNLSAIAILNIDESSKKALAFTSNNDKPYSLAFSNDNKYIASGSDGGKVSVWEVETTKLIHTFLEGENLGDKKNPNSSVIFSSGDKFFAAASGSILKIWDFKSKNLLKEIKEKDGSIEFVNFLPNNFLVYVLKNYGNPQIKIWQYEGVE